MADEDSTGLKRSKAVQKPVGHRFDALIASSDRVCSDVELADAVHGARTCAGPISNCVYDIQPARRFG